MTTIRQINSLEQMKLHLTGVYRSQPMIEMLFGKAVIGAARISYDANRPDEIVIRATTPMLPKGSVLKLKYFIDGFEYIFESEVINIRSLGNTGAFIRIRRPQTINGSNRRRYLRYYPTCQQPIHVTLTLPQSGAVAFPVQDVSASGFSFLLPFNTDVSAFKKKINCLLDLPGHDTIESEISLKNVTKRKDGFRVGAAFSTLSETNQRKLIDFTVQQTLKNRLAYRRDQGGPLPTLCLIYDNEKNEEQLSYLEQSYRLIRQSTNADWKPMARFSPDVLLFNLNTIDPAVLLPKLRNLNTLKQAPAIVIANERRVEDLSGDATVLSQFKDPAVLIEAVEQLVPVYEPPLEIASSAHPGNTQPKENTDAIFIIDLKNDLPQRLVESLEKQHFTVVVKKDSQVLLNAIQNVNPVLIGISSDIDISFENLMRMLKLNKHTKNRRLFLLLDDEDENDQKAFKRTKKSGITVFRGVVDPVDLARQITILALNKKGRDSESSEKNSLKA